MDDGVNLSRLLKWFEDSEEATYQARVLAERDRDFYDGQQLTEDERLELRRRKQPDIVINRIKRKVDHYLGLERAARTDPKAWPRTPADEAASESATDAIRYVCDNADFPAVASLVWADMLIQGAGGCDVVVEPDGADDVRVRIVHVPWDRMFYDAHSRAVDFADAKYLGVVAWMDEDDVLARWPEAESVIETSYASETPSRTYDDRPQWKVWADRGRKRVRVVQMQWRDGARGWMMASFTRGGFLDEPAPSPYVDESGEQVPSLIFVSAYVNRENERYGIVRDMIDPQREINKRRQKALHLLSVRQVVAERGAVEDVDAARRELAKPDGYVEVAPGMRFDISQTGDLASGQAQLLAEAKAELDLMGPNAAMMGKAAGSASGRAIQLSQQGGALEIGALLDQHRLWRRRVYRAIWLRIKQFWSAQKWIRVTDDERNIRFVGLNQPITLAEHLRALPPEEAAREAAALGLFDGDPRLAQVVEIRNDVSRLDVDIVVEDGPDVATLRQEQFQVIADMVRAGLPIPPDVVIMASDLRNKDQLLERLKASPPPMLQPKPEAVMETQRKAARDQADVALAAQRLALEKRKVDGEVLADLARMRAFPPVALPPAF